MRRRLVLAALLTACSADPESVPDGRVDAAVVIPSLDAGQQDGGPPLLWVEFAASGCQSFDPDGPSGPTCQGTAPLTLQFIALTPAPIDTYLWTFDGISVTDPAPVHTFSVPGLYSVMLAVGGAGGTAAQDRPGYVMVTAAPLGARCDVAAGCATGLECPLGFCTHGCAQVSCAEGEVCADLGLSPGDDDWRRPLCLVGCVDDDECGAPLRCRELRSQDGWVKGCFPEVLADDGGSCMAADGTLDNGACVSGHCRALGARGLCGADCDDGCPSYGECAELNSGGSLCLARCGSCDIDPWLACEMPGGSGDLGFDAPSGNYCGPRPCTGGDCGPDGVCDGGFCRANR